MTRTLLIFSGTFFLVLGILGIFLPILPTTPFLLLASFCYARSSQKFYRWLLNNRLCGAYIKNYIEGRGIPLKQKIFTLLLLWLTIGYSAIFIVPVVWVKILLAVIAIAVTIHLVKIKTGKSGAYNNSEIL